MRLIPTCMILSALLFLPGQAQQAPDPVPTAEEMQAHLTRRPENDMIHWKDPARGDSLEVRIVQVRDADATVQKTLQTGLTARVIPLSELSGISFARTPIEQTLIHSPSADTAGALRVLWNARSATLGMETSNVADIAIALAKSLRMTRESAGFDEADTLLQRIIESDPTDHHRAAVEMELQTLGLVRALVSESPEETDKAAWAITETNGNTEAMLMATAWLADRHFEDLKQLEQEHPRWDIDDEVRPFRSRLYHLSLDFALYPSLFHGTHVEEASTGLWKAWNVHQYTQSPELALQTLEDIAALYPKSQAANDTAAELARLQARNAQGILRDEATVEPPPEDAEDAEEQPSLPPTPPKPKRYNLFDD